MEGNRVGRQEQSMRKGLLGSILVLATGAGLAFGQMPRSAKVDANAPMGDMIQAQAQTPLNGTGQPLTGPAQVLSDPRYGYGGGPDCEPYVERIWARGDYLLWYYKPAPNPVPLITAGPVTAGTILPGAPGVVTIFGGGNIDYGGVSGGRFRVGGWLPGSDTIGIEGEGMVLAKQTVSTTIASGPLGITAIGRPFINANTGAPGTFLVAAPNTAPGAQGDVGTATGFSSAQLWTAGINLLANLYRDDFWTWNAWIGFRHLSLLEVIEVDSRSTQGPIGTTPQYFFLGAPLALNQVESISDRFSTQNRFYGGNLGTLVEYRYHRISVEVRNDLALGSMRSTVNIIGTTSAFAVGGTTNLTGSPANGGLLALPTNIGTRIQNNFSLVEQPEIEVGYQLTRGLRVAVGYDFLYTYNVARPGAQIDPGINPNLAPSSPTFGVPGGTARPTPLFALTDYYAQGVNFSLTLRY
jgi:hypothetical protein